MKIFLMDEKWSSIFIVTYLFRRLLLNKIIKLAINSMTPSGSPTVSLINKARKPLVANEAFLNGLWGLS